MPSIRFANPTDLPRLVELYNQAILSHTATGDTVPFSIEQRQGWFDQHQRDRYPIYVSEDEGGVVSGYLSLSPYRDRPAMQRTAEISYYVDYAHHRQGIGTALMEHALADCPRLGRKVLIAIVLEWNSASIQLLERFGFERWGYLPDVAELSGRLCGHLYYGRKIV